MGLKKLAVPALHAFGLWSGFSLSRARAARVARILMFHGVGDDEYSETNFEKDIRYLASHFSIIKLDELIQNLAEHRDISNQLILTFDDGLRNNFMIAYPVLERLNLPATFFVCPGLIESQVWLWNHEARARLQSLSLAQRVGLVRELNVNGGSAVEAIVAWMKELPTQQRDRAEERIRCLSSSFQPSSAQKQRYDLMTWDDLRSLNPKLITVGSHTVSHPILSTLPVAQLRNELVESRKQLEAKLQTTVDQFCYPNGAHNPIVLEEARKIYRVAVTTDAGFVTESSDPVKLPRIGIAPQPLLSWRLHRPTA